ncbi:MAG: hypothetical protein ACQESJ_11575 [Bacteroidota bacterium]
MRRRKRNVDFSGKKEEKEQECYNNVGSTSVRSEDSYHRPFNPAKREDFFSEENLNFIFDRANTKTFLHYTCGQSVADKIISEGFRFTTSFYKTTEEVYHDLTDLIYKHNKMKAYGRFVIVICIDRALFNKYLKEIQRLSSYEVFVEQVLTEVPSFLNEEGDVIYTLHYKFIKGYIDYKSGEMTKNTEFDPAYDSVAFGENLKKYSV